MLHPSGSPWTSAEDNLLESLYGTMPVKQILAANPNSFPRRTPHALHQRANKIGLKSKLRHTLYRSIRLDYFKILTPESVYWAGFLAADGSLIKDPGKPNTYRLFVGLAVKDEPHLRLFKDTIGHTGKIYHVFTEGSVIEGRTIKGVMTCRLNVCQASHFKDDLAALGVIENKTKRIPPPSLPSHLLELAWVRGYIDGDGCLSIANGVKFHIGIISSCHAILLWIKTVMDRAFPISYMDREYSEVTKNAASATWQYNVSGNRALRIVSIISRIPTPQLDRKWLQPRLLEMIEESKTNRPAVWAVRLPIEDEIDRFLASPQQSSVTPPIFA